MGNRDFTGTITEYGVICKDSSYISSKFESVVVDEEIYKEFEEFAKTKQGNEVLEFAKNGRALKAKNYVGTIQTNSGYRLEILPKIYKVSGEGEKEDKTREIFLQLLRILYKLPSYKHINSAKFDSVKNMPILEIFITMFLEEISAIIKKGIKSDYHLKEENLPFMKGKLNMSQQIQKNFIHKERFFVEYDEYNQNRAENRLIKSTLKYLQNITRDFNNKRLILQYQEHMHQIEYSRNIDGDFRKCKTFTRGMEHYKTALVWAKIFLKKESFSNFSGDTIAFAILYPMEKLFENYVEHWLKEQKEKFFTYLAGDEKVTYDDVIPQAQSGKIFIDSLLERPTPDYQLKLSGKTSIIADAKWKLIDGSAKKMNLSDDDIYRMFAYSSLFESKRLLLLYPLNDKFTKEKEFTYFNDTKLLIYPVDLNKLLEE